MRIFYFFVFVFCITFLTVTCVFAIDSQTHQTHTTLTPSLSTPVKPTIHYLQVHTMVEHKACSRGVSSKSDLTILVFITLDLDLDLDLVKYCSTKTPTLAFEIIEFTKQSHRQWQHVDLQSHSYAGCIAINQVEDMKNGPLWKKEKASNTIVQSNTKIT